MYWNEFLSTARVAYEQINRNMRCIEIWSWLCQSCWYRINRNMRCIEIVRCYFLQPLNRLIETWDVLKSEFAFPPLGGVFTINRNMRCIEIRYFSLHIHPVTRLIETWDVLKFSQPRTRHASVVGLIETWDVLKSLTTHVVAMLPVWLIETWDVLK